MSPSEKAPKTFDQLAELQVAGLFAEEGWQVYFPHRDRGFDFVAVKRKGDRYVIRPVQVKGKYPENQKTDKQVFGYVGKLSQRDPEMVLALAFFERGEVPKLKHVAFMPDCMIRSHSKGFRCQPAKFIAGEVSPRGDHRKYFDNQGLKRVEYPGWGKEGLILPATDASFCEKPVSG